jgi:hypothetical protein
MDGYKRRPGRITRAANGAQCFEKAAGAEASPSREGRKDILGPLRRGCVGAMLAKPGRGCPDMELLEKTTTTR